MTEDNVSKIREAISGFKFGSIFVVGYLKIYNLHKILCFRITVMSQMNIIRSSSDALIYSLTWRKGRVRFIWL